MLNKIWFGLLLIGIVYSFGRGTYNTICPPEQTAVVPIAMDPVAVDPVVVAPVVLVEAENRTPLGNRDLKQMGKDLNAAALSAAKVSIEICIGLIGIMALWLGLLAVARDAGLVDALARLLSPLMRWLFPDVPDGHPAQGAMLMNISANMLNLDNAATPLGLKAMQELQTLNPQKETATNSMVMFMAINTSSVTLIPFTIIGYRALSGSENPAEPMLGIFLVTSISTIVAVIVTRLLARSSRFAIVPAGPEAHAVGEEP